MPILYLSIIRYFDSTNRKVDIELLGGEADYISGVPLAAHVGGASVTAGVKALAVSFGPKPGDWVIMGVWS